MHNQYPIEQRFFGHKHMIYGLLAVLVLALLSIQRVSAENIQLEKLWETEAIFKLPESIIYDPKRDELYVSNINEDGFKKLGNGFISRVSTSGKVIQMKWITGLDAPKGLTLFNDKLYATDINSLVEIDVASGRIVNRYTAPAAIHLNDVAADSKGQIYAADTLTDSIYRLNSIGLFSLWLYSPALEAPNGLHVEGNNLIVGSWGQPTDGFSTEVPGHLKTVSLVSKEIKSLGNGQPTGNLDGVEADGKGAYLVTDWIQGLLLHVKADGSSTTLVKLSSGAADHEVIPEQKLIVIPLMKDNKLVAYKIK